MKFAIERASSLDHNEKPCERAFWGFQDYTYVDWRTCKDAEEFDRLHGEKEGTWLSNGANHRSDFIGIARDVTRTEDDWLVDIESLDDLMKLMKEEGKLIIDMSYRPLITIYDGNVE